MAGETFTQDGVIYEDLGNGQVRVVGYSDQPPVDPTFQYQGPQAAADLARAQAGASKTRADATVANATVDAEIRRANAEAAAAQAKANQAIAEAGKGGGITPGQKKADEVFAQDYAAWTAGGGMAGLENKLRVLSDALDILESSDTISGPIFGRLPKFLQQAVDPRSQDVRADVEKAIQETLRQTLGAQFTAKEGESILARTFDPTQQEQSNARRTRNLIEELRAQGEAKASAASYFEDNGTIAGWKMEQKKFSPSAGPQMQQATGERYSTPQDMKVAEAVQQVYNRGGSVRDMAEAAQRLGYPVNLQNMQEWARAIDYRDAKGEYAGQNTGYATVNPPQSGERSLAGQMYGDFARDGIGSMAVGAGIGAANAATFGGIDEVAGGINSVIRGTDFDDEVAYANLAKQGAFDNAPGSSMTGEVLGGVGLGGLTAKAFPKALETLAGSGRRALGTGTVLGGVTGAAEMNQNRFGGAIGGAVLGAGGGVLGQKVIGPGVEAIASSPPAQALGQKARAFANSVRPGSVAPSGLPMIPSSQRAAAGMMTDDIGAVRARLSEAEGLDLPYALADASPKLRSLAGSVARKSQDARQMAENVFDPRHRDQASRAFSAVEGNLASPVDPKLRAQELTEAGALAAKPYYNLANSRPAPGDDEIAAFLNTKTGKAALGEARTIAENQGRNPDEMGFILEPNGNVGLNGFTNTGRFSRVPIGNPRDTLTAGTVRGMNGDVPVRGPTDLVGWLRLQGGLRDSGGELQHMGINNAGRKGQDFVGQEARFGPLLSEQGMNFDDAALRAWEAGYFPHLSERPSVNEFLDAVRGTYDGYDRRFTADAMPELEAFDRASQQSDAARIAQQDGGLWADNSQPAGMMPPLPDGAYGREAALPSFETLDLVKQGIDAQIYGPANTNPVTGELNKLSPSVRSLEQFRQNFVGALDRVNPDYPKARAAYQPYAKAREALELGMKGPSARVKPRDIERITGGMTDQSLEEYRGGFATTLADMVGDTKLSGNPYERIFGGTSQRDKIGMLYPEGSRRFARAYDLERDMAQTRYETLGGSPTAARMAADDQFGEKALEMGADFAADLTATGGALTAGNLLKAGARGVRDMSRLGIGRQAERRADALAPILYNTDPAAAKVSLDQIEKYLSARQKRKGLFGRRAGMFGASAPVVLIPSE